MRLHKILVPSDRFYMKVLKFLHTSNTTYVYVYIRKCTVFFTVFRTFSVCQEKSFPRITLTKIEMQISQDDLRKLQEQRRQNLISKGKPV